MFKIINRFWCEFTLPSLHIILRISCWVWIWNGNSIRRRIMELHSMKKQRFIGFQGIQITIQYTEENWNFQLLFEKEFGETSQNFNSIRQSIEKMEITIVWMSWMSWNFVRFPEILFPTDAESFSFLSWKTRQKIIL